ncbi:aspartic proteinase A2-like [Sipha flava]|uniref:Aspartic proteinase A2-like n=1 Tax=Sipha flava TaxID=143950 RepID=A0A2S2QYE5_9HEMI|nr:aspartic proteinase A2-like [Sipha flava]
MICRLIFFMIFYELPYLSTSTVKDSNAYDVYLIRQESPLEYFMIENANTNINKHKLTNENITLFKHLDSEYYAEILVGKPGQKFRVIFETAWGDMWIPSKLCSKTLSPLCISKNLYDSNISSTHKSIDPAPYEAMGLSGNLTCDTVRLAHMNVSDLVFAEIKEIPNTEEFQNMYADGIIGLGYQSLSKIDSDPFFYKLLGDKKILNPIFSVYLNRDVNTNKGGTIFLGGVSKKHIDGEITYIPVTSKNYWQIEMNQFSVQLNKTNAKTFCNPTCQAILSTGSNKIGVPKEHVAAINTLIDAEEYFNNRYVVSCLQVNKLPTITLNFGGRDFHISGRHYIQKIDNETNGLICMSVFCDSNLPGGLWSLGGGFLSSVYTTFDLENNEVGFAKLK